MTKIAGSGSISQRRGSGSGSTPKCHGSATLPKTYWSYGSGFRTLVHLHHSSKIKSRKEANKNSRNQGFLTSFAWWWKVSEPDPVLVTNGSGCGSGRPKNIRIWSPSTDLICGITGGECWRNIQHVRGVRRRGVHQDPEEQARLRSRPNGKASSCSSGQAIRTVKQVAPNSDSRLKLDSGLEQGCGSAFISSGSGSSILGWIPIRILIQGFNDQKLKKKNYS